MILQTSFADQIQTITTLTGAIDLTGTKRYGSLSELAAGYRRFLNSLNQRTVDTARSTPKLITSLEEAMKLSAYFSNDSLLDDKAQTSVISNMQDDQAVEKEARLSQAIFELGLLSTEHSALFHTIITEIFVLPSNVAKGGSTSQAIGAIWANPRVSYSTSDIIEILVHEFTHHTMFLDELRHHHYSYEQIMDQSTWAHSAILKVARPLDKVLHSIVVAVEVLLFREAYLGHPVNPKVHPPTSLLVDQLNESISSTERALLNNRAVFNARAADLLENAKMHVNSKFGSSHKSRKPLNNEHLQVC